MDLAYLRNNPKPPLSFHYVFHYTGSKTLNKYSWNFGENQKIFVWSSVILETVPTCILITNMHSTRDKTLFIISLTSLHILMSRIIYFPNGFFPEISLLISRYSNSTILKSPPKCTFCRKPYLAKPSKTIVLFPGMT